MIYTNNTYIDIVYSYIFRCTSTDSKKYHLMHNFKKISDKIVYAEMFAFHFATDKDITIECDVRICSAEDKATKCFLKTVGVSIVYMTYDVQS